jgi:hypothetical protein
MFNLRQLTRAMVVCLSELFSGCGLSVPELRQITYTQAPDTMVAAIVGYVHCEVKSQVQFLLLDDEDAGSIVSPASGLPQGRRLDWLRKWAAQAILTLTIDEKTTLNPGLSLNTIFKNDLKKFVNGTVTTPQSSAWAFGATASADATRKETLSWYIDFADFAGKSAKARMEMRKARIERDRLYNLARISGAATPDSACGNQNGILIQGDLKFREWLYAALLPAFVQGGIISDYAASLAAEAKASKKDVLSHQITFVILYSGSINPSWKLVNVSIDQSSTLFNTQRTSTQDLIITLGPSVNGAPSQSAQNAALASQIGLAVANAIRNTQ